MASSEFGLATPVTLLLVGVCLFLWSWSKCRYWRSRGVPCFKPVLPVVGNMYDLLFLRSLPDITDRIYKQTEGLPYVGIYAFHTPVFFVRDLDLMSRMMIKDFNHFEDRGFHYNKGDSLGRNLLHQNGADWKYTRSKLSPCFSVARVRDMLPVMEGRSERLVERLLDAPQGVEVWDLALRYTTDVVVHSTLGVGSDSLSDQRDLFRESGSHMLGLYFIYHVLTGCFLPGLHKALGISVAKARVSTFFHNVLNQILEVRKNNGTGKKDLINTLIQLKEDNISKSFVEKPTEAIDNNFIVAQAFSFFLAGFETPGNVLACALYEIARQPYIQQSLLAEIKSVLHKHNEEVSFDALQDMKYLRQIISETLRIYTPLTLIFRRCTKEYQIPGTRTVIEKGTLVLVPLRSVHNDSKLYPNPNSFEPERFSDENSAKRHIAEFMPFGIGPRVCPAILYSHMSIRMAVVKVLLKFEVCLADKTPSSLQASPVDFLWAPKNGIHLKFRQR